MNKQEKNLKLRKLFEEQISVINNNYEGCFDVIIDETNANGTFCLYELEELYEIWLLGRLSMKNEAIKSVETYEVSVGNSSSGELACEWTMNNLRDIRDEIREF